MNSLSSSFKVILFIFIVLASVVSVSVPALADDITTTPPVLQGHLVSDGDPAFNAEPTVRTNETTVTVHLIGAEGWYDAVHLAEDVMFSSNTQSHWRPPLGDYDGGTTVTFILSSGDALKTIWAVLDSGGETFSTPPTSATLILDTTQPDVASSTLQTQPDLRLHVTMEFSESVHEFTADDIWLGGVALAVEEFGGEGTEYSFDVVAGGEGELTIGFFTDDVFDLAGNPIIEQASPLVEYYPFISLETPGATESAALTGGFFLPPLSLLEEADGDAGMMLMGTMDPVWVDFDWQTPLEGTEEAPFNTLQAGLSNVIDSGTVIIKAGTSAETPTIDQSVRIEASGGTARIGDLTAGTTQYIQLAFGIPTNTPENGLLGQIVKGAGAEAEVFEIGEVKAVINGVESTVPSGWFELEAQGEGSYNLAWTAPGGVDLTTIEHVSVEIDKITSTEPVFDRTFEFPVTSDVDGLRWIPTFLAAANDIWRMKVKGPGVNLTYTASPGITNDHRVAYQIGGVYDVSIEQTGTTPPPEPGVPYLGYFAGVPVGDAVNGWKAGAGFWAYDPSSILHEAYGNQEGEAKLFFDDLNVELSSSQPVALSEGTKDLFLTRCDFTTDNTLKRRNVTLTWPGLNELKAQGLTESEATLTISQGDESNFGRVRVYASYHGAPPVFLMPEGLDSATIASENFDAQESVKLIIEGASVDLATFPGSAAGRGALDVTLRCSADSESSSVHDDRINYHVIEPFDLSIAETARVYNEKRFAISMEPDEEPPVGSPPEEIKQWFADRNLVFLHDCDSASGNDGSVTLEMMETPPFAETLLYEFEKLEGFGTPPPPGFLVYPGFADSMVNAEFFNDTFYNLDPDYEVRLGFDTNADGALDYEERLIGFGLHLVTESNYIDSAQLLAALISGEAPVDPKDLALNLITRFFAGSWNLTVPTFNPNSPSSITTIRGSHNPNELLYLHDLTHDFGSTAFAGRWKTLTADVPLYIWDDGSAASDRIEADIDFHNAILQHIGSDVGISISTIENQYQSPETRLVFINQVVTLIPGLYDSIFDIGTGEFDSYGEISFKAEKNGNEYTISDVRVDMLADDLFDYNYFNIIWNMFNVEGPQAGASYQAGKGRCGNSNGEVFVTQIHLDSAIPGQVIIVVDP